MINLLRKIAFLDHLPSGSTWVVSAVYSSLPVEDVGQNVFDRTLAVVLP